MSTPHEPSPPNPPDARRASWTGEDVTIGGGSAPQAPQAPITTAKTTPKHDDSSSSAIPAWTGEDATIGGGSAPQVPPLVPITTAKTAPKHDDSSSSSILAWTGEDVTSGGGSSPLVRLPEAGWTGEDATIGGGSRPQARRPASDWTGDAVTGTWKPEAGDDTKKPGADPVGTKTPAVTGAASAQELDSDQWFGQAAEALRIIPAWTGEDVTSGGGSPATPAPFATPKPDTAREPAIRTPHPTASGSPTPTARSSGSDRLRKVDGVGRTGVIEALRQQDAGWLDNGRSGDLTGKTLGDFLIGAVLGEGGMGVVYRARQISLDRRVALKVLPPAMAADPVLMERFAGEAHTAGLLISPHVVQVYFAGNVDGQVFFAMEFVSGTDLAHLNAEQRQAGTFLPPERAARYLAQAARGLAEAEVHKIVHRDIKPQNLLLSGHDTVKIADFGIAKVMGEHQLTLTGNAIGTPAYCSPEQGRGDEVDQRSDLYALGVVFYELLTGQKPFTGTQADQLIYQHNYAEPKPPSSLRPDLDPAFENVCMRLLMKDPEQRYQHAADLAVDLEALVAGRQVQAPPFQIRFGTGAQVAMRKHLGHRRWLPWTIAATLAVGAGVALWLGSQSLEADEATRRRTALAALDQVASVPRSASEDLAWLAQHLGNDNQDVRRWRTKLARLETLRGRLIRLDADAALPEAALRTASENDCAAWESEVGSQDPDALRWRGRIQAAQDEIARLRGVVNELDRSELPTLAQAERLRPPLASLATLAGSEDAEVKRWQGKLAEQERTLASARTALAALTGSARLTEFQLIRLRESWRQYRAIVGDEDAQTAAWGRQLDQREAILQQLRDSAARLDRVDFATTTLQAELAEPLARLAELVAADDARLVAWQAKIAASNQRITSLRHSLGTVLDAPAHPDADTLAACQQQWADYRALVSADDGHLLAWERRLKTERDEIQAFLALLPRLDQDQPLTLAEQAACRQAADALTSRGVLHAERNAMYQRRLSAEAARIARLRAVLVQAMQPGAGITPAVHEAVTALAAATAGDDAEVRAWQARLAEFQRLHDNLAVLDRIAPLPTDAERLLVALAQLVPADDAELRRWQGKTARVTELHRLLEPLARAAPPPEGHQEWLNELAERLTGPDDAVVVQGRTKLMRLLQLDALLTGIDTALALPLDRDAEALAAERIHLVGEGGIQAVRQQVRIRQLAGPGRPAWASDYGRDVHGLWAELIVGDSRQRLRFIPGGTMRLGSPVSEPGRDSDESPPQAVTLRAFWLADSECTQALYAAVLAAWPAVNRNPERPVENVTRADALNFCTALARLVPGAAARLPLDQEWEYACRAGVAGAWCGPQGPLPVERLGEIAWFGRSDASRPVRLLQANAFGLYDCHGNVWEWVADHDQSGENGLVRGGSWADRASLLRAANRLALPPQRRTAMVGFRFAIKPAWPDGREPGFE